MQSNLDKQDILYGRLSVWSDLFERQNVQQDSAGFICKRELYVFLFLAYQSSTLRHTYPLSGKKTVLSILVLDVL
jgi:hypothetical protein